MANHGRYGDQQYDRQMSFSSIGKGSEPLTSISPLTDIIPTATITILEGDNTPQAKPKRHASPYDAPPPMMSLRQSMAAMATDMPGRLNTNQFINEIQQHSIGHELAATDASPVGEGGRYAALSLSSEPSSVGSMSPNGALQGQPSDLDIEPFLLQTMPSQVTTLVFSLLSNWGDSYYVGLSGIEIFDAKGKRIVPATTNDKNSPSVTFSIHSTFDFISKLGGGAAGGIDLRASCVAGASNLSNASQLINGHCKSTTTDSNEMFRMPVNLGAAVELGGMSNRSNNALIWISFSRPVDISLIRIYNYNAGREQTCKGVKLLEILYVSDESLNAHQQQQLIFRGEISEGSGDRFNQPEQIFFVGEEQVDILTTIVEEDKKAASSLKGADPMMYVGDDADTHQVATNVMETKANNEVASPRPPSNTHSSGRSSSPPVPRPITSALAAPIVTSYVQKQTLQRVGSASASRAESISSISSITGASPRGASVSTANAPYSAAGSISNIPVVTSAPSQSKTVTFTSDTCDSAAATKKHPPSSDPASCPKNVTSVCIGIQSTWGDPHFVGISGIRFYTASGEQIFNVVQMAIARPPTALTGYSETEMASLVAFDAEVAAIADEDPSTACVWRFQDQMQLRVRFDPPVPSLGFIEIANYGISGSTQCGVKAAQIFVSSTLPLSIYEKLWQSSTLPPGVSMLTTSDTPLIIRKSPNQMNLLKYQSFDLSMESGGKEGIRGASSLTSSLTASMAARAKTELKRARMSLFDGPPADPNVLPHGVAVASSLLPQGYVIKLELGLSITASNLADLKPLLKAIVKEGISRTHQSAITLFDEDCQPISKELYTVAVTLRHEESTAVLTNSSGVFQPPMTQFGGDVTASIVIDRGFRDALQSDLSPSSPSASLRDRHNICLTFTFVFDVPTAISAISHHFRSLQSAQGRIAPPSLGGLGAVTGRSASISRIKILVDDEPLYESLEFDMEGVAAAMLHGGEAEAVEPPPRCVAFVWDPKLLGKF